MGEGRGCEYLSLSRVRLVVYHGEALEEDEMEHLPTCNDCSLRLGRAYIEKTNGPVIRQPQESVGARQESPLGLDVGSNI